MCQLVEAAPKCILCSALGSQYCSCVNCLLALYKPKVERIMHSQQTPRNAAFCWSCRTGVGPWSAQRLWQHAHTQGRLAPLWWNCIPCTTYKTGPCTLSCVFDDDCLVRLPVQACRGPHPAQRLRPRQQGPRRSQPGGSAAGGPAPARGCPGSRARGAAPAAYLLCQNKPREGKLA